MVSVREVWCGDACHRARRACVIRMPRWASAVIRSLWRKEEAELSETAFSSSRRSPSLLLYTVLEELRDSWQHILHSLSSSCWLPEALSQLSSDSIRHCDFLLLARVLFLLAEHSLQWVQNCPLHFITRVIHGFYPCLLSVHGRIDPTLVSSPESFTNFNRTTYSGNGCAADLIQRITCTHRW